MVFPGSAIGTRSKSENPFMFRYRSSLWDTCAILAVGAILLLGFAVALAQNTPGKAKPDGKDQPAKQPETRKGDASKVRLKVFRLSHSDPEQVSGVLKSLLPEESDSVAAGPVAPIGGGMLGFGGGGMLGLAGGGAGLGGAPAGNGLGGGLGGLGGGLGGVGGPTWRLAADPRTKSLIIRGSEKEVDIAADLVAVLDLPADKPIPKVKNLRAYKLKHASAQDLNTLLSSLMDARMVPVEKGNILIVAGTEDVMKDMDSVVEALDIEVQQSKEPPKPNKEGKRESEEPSKP
jgi:hypothetical protein